MLMFSALLALTACESLPPAATRLIGPAESAITDLAPTAIPLTPTATATETPTPTPTVTPTPTATPLPTPMVEVMSASGDAAVRLRSGPGSQHDVIGALQPGQFAELAEINDDGTWAKIDTGELQGWLPANWIVLTGEISFDMPGPTQRTRDGLIQAWESVNVRAGPGRQFRVLGRLAPGQIAPVIGKSADERWWQILFQSREGWVARDVVQFAGDGERVEVTGGEPAATQTPGAPSEITPSPESTSPPPTTAIDAPVP